MAGRQDRPTGSWARQHPPLPEPESADELIWAVFGALRAGRPTRADQAIRALAVRVGPGSREVGVLTTMLHDCLSAAWDSGWQPADLHRLTERRLEDEACVLLRDAMAAHLATFSAASVHPRWHDQLTALDARCWWDPSGSYLDARLQRWGVEAQAEASALRDLGSPAAIARGLGEVHTAPQTLQVLAFVGVAGLLGFQAAAHGLEQHALEGGAVEPLQRHFALIGQNDLFHILQNSLSLK